MYDEDDQGALSRLGAAASLASAHGSVALVRRCERDIAVRSVRGAPPSVRQDS
jgi:hypothetical protein